MLKFSLIAAPIVFVFLVAGYIWYVVDDKEFPTDQMPKS
jgi:hypothetical protein